MSKEISTPVIVGVIVVLLVVIVVVGFKVLGSPKSSMSAEQQKESMRHMIPYKK